MMDADQKFFEFVQARAAQMRSAFILHAFEGRESDEPIDGMAVDDVSGWLVPKKELAQFKREMRNRHPDAKTDARFGFFVWHIGDDGALVLDWKKWNDWSAFKA